MFTARVAAVLRGYRLLKVPFAPRRRRRRRRRQRRAGYSILTLLLTSLLMREAAHGARACGRAVSPSSI